ncbi:HAMP domain-containing protein [Pseudomonas mediterranea]|jgi:signal transduction histidine kinase|uniref:ATP-binding protein n=1 Tax=Pseudomonas mediterranea TaxID=183795 RepID=UPI0006D8B096|nr:ATP-binding protein [Pseudomonas mediterranea]MBL0843903.1 HAMP domain-containing protein [Pseudomonas mediterranea]MDU9027943.1 ATP-binding protein [Pseudomonas mediterranea]QHA80241.1 HAMP domain-containing protein [Pseudomonas mediterranea]UZE01116.1 ATP-binding protein [Pseudomonas mediterranea]
MKLALQWPRTLASRLWLVFLVGLILAQSLTFAAQYYERYQSTKTAMLGNFEHDTATSIAILDRLPADERLAWTKRLQRRNYDYLLREHDPGIPLASNDLAATAAQSLQVALGSNYDLTFVQIPGPQQHFQAQVRLADGSPVTIDVRPSVKPLSPWLPFVLFGQLVLLIGCTWLAVRIAIRPLSRLAEAVENLDPNAHPVQLDENGPREVAYAARAFNSMQARIAAYLKERMQLLAAISHDLQTPITRMKLRAEFMDDSLEKDKLGNDLNEIEHLVREGVAYARSVHGATEASCRISLDSFLDSLVCDYQDTGREVSLRGNNGAVIETRPHALRRILVNLVDNALKYAGTAEVEISGDASKGVSISVLDRGPGIPDEVLAEVVKPFYRVESSRNRSTGGTGLGLAIAQQLTVAIGGALSLRNRDGGGLCVTLDFGPNR